MFGESVSSYSSIHELIVFIGLRGHLGPSQGCIAITLGPGISGGRLMNMSYRLSPSSYVELGYSAT